MKKKKLFSAMRLTLCTILALLFLFPTVLTFCTSFMSSREVEYTYGDAVDAGQYITEPVQIKLIPDVVSGEQYSKVLLQSPDYLQKFWNSVLLVVPITLFQLAVAALAAYGFARYRGKLRTMIFFGYIILLLMPYQVTLVPNYFFAKWTGLLNTRWAVILPGIFSPFSVYLLTKQMRRIPKSYFEAAHLDGAGEWRIFSGICLPLCKSSLMGVSLLVFFDYWGMVEQPLILLEDEALHPLSVFLNKITAGEVGVTFAAATVYLVPCLLLFLYGEKDLCESSAVSDMDG
ncbi:MAG: carbohydrate ABC transporter permease [Faecousia sp.]